MSYKHKSFIIIFFTNKWPGGRFLQCGSWYYRMSWKYHNRSIVFDELNVSISLKEVSESIKQLKNGKASTEDFLVNEFFIRGSDRYINSTSSVSFSFCLWLKFFPKIGARNCWFHYTKSNQSINQSNHFRCRALVPFRTLHILHCWFFRSAVLIMIYLFLLYFLFFFFFIKYYY